VPVQVVVVGLNEQLLKVRLLVVPPGFLETATVVVILFKPVKVTVVEPTWFGRRGPMVNGLALTLKSTTVTETVAVFVTPPDVPVMVTR
jgi:hypothetical protein